VTWFHGWHAIATCYGLTAAGLLFGFIQNHSHPKHILLVPLSAAVFSIITALLLGLVSLLPIHLGQTLGVILSLPCFVYVGAFAGEAIALGDDPSLNHKRGTILKGMPRLLNQNVTNRNTLTLAGFPVNPSDETKHFKMIGTTGTGKSTAIRELLGKALERGDRAVIADPDGSYLSRFYDPARGDVILNPFEAKAARWDLFAEMHTHYDADQLAVSLIPDTEGTERPWRGYARVFLTSLLRQLHRVQHHDVAELYRLLTTTPADDLRDLLTDTPAGPYLAQDNGKFFGAVRAVANTHLSALEHIARQTSRDNLSVRDWVRKGQGARGGILFLPYRANEIATLKSLISTWMRLAIFEAMNQHEGDQRLWFIIDELDALGPIDGLKDALARLRKFGGRCVIGFQSIAQVSGTYGHAEAQTIVENCGNTLILRCSASEGGGTARFASSLIGEREVIREQTTKSRGGGPIFANDHRSVSTSLQHVTESAVLASEIEQLPDLQGYLKFASQPEWKRIKLTLST
jgi:type IV secretory pathway TraG/TraD family ATPase VirD4